MGPKQPKKMSCSFEHEITRHYVQVVPFSEAVMKMFRDHGNRGDRQKTRLMWLVEELGEEKFRNLVATYMAPGTEFGAEVHPAYPDVWKRRDYLGVHPQKQEGLSWVCFSQRC